VCMDGKPMRLAGAHEVRELLGVSRQRVYQLAARPDFPEPVAILAQGKVWAVDDIEQWIADYRAPSGEADLVGAGAGGVTRPAEPG
jgi:prophage regulatory protein